MSVLKIAIPEEKYVALPEAPHMHDLTAAQEVDPVLQNRVGHMINVMARHAMATIPDEATHVVGMTVDLHALKMSLAQALQTYLGEQDPDPLLVKNTIGAKQQFSVVWANAERQLQDPTSSLSKLMHTVVWLSERGLFLKRLMARQKQRKQIVDTAEADARTRDTEHMQHKLDVKKISLNTIEREMNTEVLFWQQIAAYGEVGNLDAMHALCLTKMANPEEITSERLMQEFKNRFTLAVLLTQERERKTPRLSGRGAARAVVKATASIWREINLDGGTTERLKEIGAKFTDEQAGLQAIKEIIDTLYDGAEQYCPDIMLTPVVGGFRMQVIPRTGTKYPDSYHINIRVESTLGKFQEFNVRPDKSCKISISQHNLKNLVLQERCGWVIDGMRIGLGVPFRKTERIDTAEMKLHITWIK